MATKPEEEKSEEKEEGKFECNICFDTARDAVVSMCGHLFCWPCIHTWMETRPHDTPTCPVCKSVIDKEKLIPLYGRGSTNQSDPREKVPPRPQGQREEAPPPIDNDGFFGDNMGGVNISFGLGTFPFGFGLGPMFTFQTGGGGVLRPNLPRRTHQRGRPPPRREDEQRQMTARLMLTFAILFIIMIIFS